MNRAMPPCWQCGHSWPLHIIPGGVENIDIYPTERHCVEEGCRCRTYTDKPEPTWCSTCESWRFALACGRDDCPHPDADTGEYVALLRERDELLALLKDVELVINPRDMGGISLHEWGSRLRVATAKIQEAIAKAEGK